MNLAILLGACPVTAEQTNRHEVLLSMSSQSGKDAPYPWVFNLCSGRLLDQS